MWIAEDKAVDEGRGALKDEPVVKVDRVLCCFPEEKQLWCRVRCQLPRKDGMKDVKGM